MFIKSSIRLPVIEYDKRNNDFIFISLEIK